MTYGNNELHFYYDASGKPMSVVYNGVTYYYILNLQGDVVAILDSNGTKVVGYSYDAWGNPLTLSGSMSTTLGLHNPLRYRGYVYDQESGLYYLQSRYYNPEIGRFINADSLVSTGQGVLGYNMFAYCGNNPVMRADESGNFWITIGIMAIGGVIGGASYIADCKVNQKPMMVDELFVATAGGAISGAIGGSGANEHLALTGAIKTAKQTITRMSAIEGSAGFAAGTGVSNAITSTWSLIREWFFSLFE
jgi:RHS repeat-associated protein